MTNTSTKARDAEGREGKRREEVGGRHTRRRQASGTRAFRVGARENGVKSIKSVSKEEGVSRAEEKGVGRASSAEAFDPLTDGIVSCFAKSRAPLSDARRAPSRRARERFRKRTRGCARVRARSLLGARARPRMSSMRASLAAFAAPRVASAGRVRRARPPGEACPPSGDVNDGRACWRDSGARRRLHARRAATCADDARTDADDDGDASDILADPPPSPARAAANPRRPTRSTRSSLAPQASSATVRRRASGGAAEILPTFAEGMEVFLLLSAGGLKVAQARERDTLEASRARYAAAVSRGVPAQPPPPPAFQGHLADAALFGAVAFGAILRRTSATAARVDAGTGPVSGSARGLEGSQPTSVLARVRNLEMNQDRIAEAANRANRDVSRVATRVRLTRRELSPPVRRMEASAAEHAAVAAALERRVASHTEDYATAQQTMAALRDVTAKQFEALAGAVTDLKRARSEAEIEASAARRAAAEAAAEEAAATTAESKTKRNASTLVDPSTESASPRGPASTPPPALIRAQKSRKPWSGPGFPGAVELAARQAAAKDAEISTSDRPRSDVSTTASTTASDDSIASDDSTASDDSIASAPQSPSITVDAEMADGDGEDAYARDGEDGGVGDVGGGVVRVERRRSWTFRVRGAGEGARRRRSGDDARSKETPQDDGLPESREVDEGENP